MDGGCGWEVADQLLTQPVPKIPAGCDVAQYNRISGVDLDCAISGINGYLDSV